MTYAERYEDITACPACGSGRICCVAHPDSELDFCMECHKFWERIGAGEHWKTDGEMLAFKKPCDNCAFRGGSTERLDKERWADLQQQLAMGGQFFCHKGVPLRASLEELMAGAPETRMVFDFPFIEKTVDAAGKCVPYQAYDTDNMRMCRGWLNAFVKRRATRGVKVHAKAIDNEKTGGDQGVDLEPAGDPRGRHGTGADDLNRWDRLVPEGHLQDVQRRGGA